MIKVLVVDDEQEICNFVRDFFKERGIEVITALNGEEALEMIKNEEELTVLLDIRMPKMGGMEALRRIKKEKPRFKVIMVTCIDDIEKMEEAKRCGAEAYLTKPLVLKELLKVVMNNVPGNDKSGK
ncbi:MAG: response regulator [Candidatus Omnitrophica bacterium]|nr:response regulator [Candidatus Omnitrophota bacterium]